MELNFKLGQESFIKQVTYTQQRRGTDTKRSVELKKVVVVAGKKVV